MTTPANTPELSPVNPVVEVVLDEIIHGVKRTTQHAEAGRRILQAGDPSDVHTVTQQAEAGRRIFQAGDPSEEVIEAQLAEAGRRILQAGDPSAMFAELMKHPVTGEPIDYEESRRFYG
jgi:orotidine-5'-phosphate decarboxylase